MSPSKTDSISHVSFCSESIRGLFGLVPHSSGMQRRSVEKLWAHLDTAGVLDIVNHSNRNENLETVKSIEGNIILKMYIRQKLETRNQKLSIVAC